MPQAFRLTSPKRAAALVIGACVTVAVALFAVTAPADAASSALVTADAGSALIVPLVDTSVTDVSASADAPSAGASQVVYTVDFKAEHALAQETEFIQLKAPTGTVFQSSGAYYAVTDGGHTGAAASATVDPRGAGDNVVDVYTSDFNIAAGDTVEVQAYGVKNPTAAESSGELEVSTSSDTAAVAVPLAIGAASAVSEVKTSASSTSANATDVLYTASFKATHALSGGDPDHYNEFSAFIQLKAPTGTVFQSNGAYYAVTDGGHTGAAASATVGPGGAGENVVDVYVPAFNVAAGDTVEVQAYGVKNPTAAESSGEVSVSTSSDTAAVAVPLAIGVASAVSELKASASSTSADGSDVLYAASFKATHALTGGDPDDDNEFPGFVQLKAPTGTVFQNNRAYYAVIDGAHTGDAASATVNPGGAGENVVDVYIPDFNVDAGDTVDVQAYGVKNPTSAVPTGEVSVSTSSDTVPASVPLAIGAASAVSEVKASANTYSASAKDVVYEVGFKATQALATGDPDDDHEFAGFIRLTAPAGTMFSAAEELYRVVLGAGPESEFASHVVVSPEGAGSNVVDVYLPSGANLTAGEAVRIQAYGVANPTAPVPSGELSVRTTADSIVGSAQFVIGAATSIGNLRSELFDGSYNEHFVATSSVSDAATGNFTHAPGYVRFMAPDSATLPTAEDDYEFTATVPGGAGVRFQAERVEVSGATVTIYLGANIKAGDEVELTINGVGTPSAGEVHLATSSDSTEPGANTTVAVPLSGTVTFKGSPVTTSTSVQACELGGGGCKRTGTTSDGAFTFGVPPVEGARYELTATPPPFGGVGSASNSSEARVGPVTIPHSGGVTGLDLALGTTAKLAKGVTVLTDGGEQTSKTADPSSYTAEPYELKLGPSLFPKGKRVLITQVVVHGTNGLTDEPMTKVVDVGGAVGGLPTGLVLGKQPLTVNMPEAYPMHGEVRTTVNYRVLRGPKAPIEGVASTPVLAEIYPSTGEPSTDPLPAYFINYGNPSGISIGPATITGPDASDFKIVALSDYGTPETSTDCGSSAATLSQSSSPSPASECGIAVRFTPPADANPDRVYYHATLKVSGGSSGDSDIPVSLVGCDAVAAEGAGKGCYQGVNSEEEKPIGPEMEKTRDEEEKQRAEDEIRKLEDETQTKAIEEALQADREIVAELAAEIILAEIEVAESIEEYEAEKEQLAEEVSDLAQEQKQLEMEGGHDKEIDEIKHEIEEREEQFEEVETVLHETETQIKNREENGDPEEAGAVEAGDMYKDPSGTVSVKTAEGGLAPLAAATVTLESSYLESGPFTVVENGSSIMSPANRLNPGVTTADGHFGWDVLAGYYTIAATKSGCNPAPQETAALTIPPPVENLSLTLECAVPPSLSTPEVTVSSSVLNSNYGQAVTFTADVSGGSSPTGTVTFYDGADPIGEGAGVLQDGKASMTIRTLVPGPNSITADYSGDGANKPVKSAAITQTVGASSSGQPGNEKQPSTGTSTTSTPQPIPTPQSSSTGTASARGGSGAASLITTKLAVLGRHAIVKLRCEGPGTCSGTLTLSVKSAKGKGHSKRAKLTLIGTVAYTIRSGASATVRLPLGGAGRKLLAARHGKLRATLAIGVSGSEPSSSAATVTLVSKPS